VEEAFDNVRESIEAHSELLAEDGKEMSRPKPMSDWQADREADRNFKPPARAKAIRVTVTSPHFFVVI